MNAKLTTALGNGFNLVINSLCPGHLRQAIPLEDRGFCKRTTSVHGSFFEKFVVSLLLEIKS